MLSLADEFQKMGRENQKEQLSFSLGPAAQGAALRHRPRSWCRTCRPASSSSC
ncbi:MAG: hypothetical protein WKG07_24655 [Hymenobacter sp.]